MRYPAELISLIASFKRLPGVGSKTAERFAFQLLNWSKEDLAKFSLLLGSLKEKIRHCPECHCLTESGGCFFCHDQSRNQQQICVISSAKEAFSLEETRVYNGLYHVLGGLLSPIEGRDPSHLRLHELQERVAKRNIQEVIIALDSTLEGDTTALYLKEQLQTWGVRVFRLAFGLPVGSALDFVDGGTLAKALSSRQLF